MGRSIGLDVHRDFCEVAILDEQGGRRSGRVPSMPQDLQLFAESLAGDDRVALEVTGNAWEIARILEAHVARVIVVSPNDTGHPPGARQDRPSRRPHLGQAAVGGRARRGLGAR